MPNEPRGGTNRLIYSDNTIKGNNIDALQKKFVGNANEIAKGIKEIKTKKSYK